MVYVDSVALVPRRFFTVMQQGTPYGVPLSLAACPVHSGGGLILGAFWEWCTLWLKPACPVAVMDR